MCFFEILETLCTRNNTSVTAVLKELGYSTSKGTAWRNGSIPTGDILLNLAKRFNVSVDYLLGYTPNEHSDGKTEKLLTFASKLTDEQLDTFIETYSRILEQLK